MNYYNEWDKPTAAWLRELIANKLIPFGYVDDRSITEVTPSDLEGFTQCHFFAGIGGWSFALQLAGIPASTRLWTGSPPCQPFSVAGQSLGFDDERHLAPVLLRLVRECKPQYLFGEQVAAAIKQHWLDFVFLNLEASGYTCGQAVLPACSIGAPHKRDRLFFGAMADSRYDTSPGETKSADHEGSKTNGSTNQPGGCGLSSGQLANSNDARPQRRRGVSERADQQSAGASGMAGELAYPYGRYTSTEGIQRLVQHGQPTENLSVVRCAAEGLGDRHFETHAPDANHGFWSAADWLGCRDGKWRPVEPGTFPLANGIPARVGRLRGYGNAIVPQVAAAFLKGFFESLPTEFD